MRAIIFSLILSAALAVVCIINVGGPDSRTVSDPTGTSPALAVSPPANSRELAKELVRARKSIRRLTPARPYIVINTHDNTVSLRTQDSVLLTALCSTGSGTVLADSVTGRVWKFTTPHGIFRVTSKLEQPWWRKPDWAFIEENEPIPSDDRERLDPTTLGEYALGFGDGYFIHGTLYERLLGINVTHGCVRVGSEDLKRLFDRVQLGDWIYVF